MTFTVTSPITGAPMSGLTSPTYTVVADRAPTQFGSQWAVTALGGTQTGVVVHSINQPFTLTFVRPATYKTPAVSANGTFVRSNQRNVWKRIARKGCIPALSYTPEIVIDDSSLSIPVGCETYDAVSVKALQSMLFGAMWTNGTNWADAVTTGIV